MNEDKAAPPEDAEQDESAVSRAELHIEREKIQIERERLALERERMAAERERWKNDAELKSRAEGRGIAFSTLVFVGLICVLAGVIAGFLSVGPRAARTPGIGFEALTSRVSTNAAAANGKPILLRPVDTGGGSKAYLLILD
jgi:hypothetical protein